MGFTQAGGETLRGYRPFDAAFAFECLHDMPRPHAIRAGFGEVQILPIQDFSFFRFYWLR